MCSTSRRQLGPWFNIKMTSYQYRKSHCEDRTILRPSYLHNGISYTGKTTSLYWIRALVYWMGAASFNEVSDTHLRMSSSTVLQWRHNGCDGVSNHRRLDYLHNRLFRHRSKKTSKLRVTGLCEGNSPVTGEFPSQRVGNAENVSIWWCHHGHPIFEWVEQI